MIFRLSRLSAKIGPDANTPETNLQLLATIQQACPKISLRRPGSAKKKLVNKTCGFEAFNCQIWIPALFGRPGTNEKRKKIMLKPFCLCTKVRSEPKCAFSPCRASPLLFAVPVQTINETCQTGAKPKKAQTVTPVKKSNARDQTQHTEKR